MRIPSLAIAPARALARACLAFALAAAIIFATAAAAFCASTPSPASDQPAPVVAILLSPFLSFADLSPSRTPVLWSLAENGAVGSMNAITADAGWPTVAGGALTLSAGRWASAAPTGPADAASLARQLAANNRSLARPVLGALGDAVHAALGRTAAVGTSDQGTGPQVVPLRPSELVATDSQGRIDFTATGNDLLAATPGAPFDVRTDPARLRAAIALALSNINTGSGQGLLVVDTGDLSRVHAAASQPRVATSRLYRDRTAAVAALDVAASDLIRQLPPGSLLLVVTPTTDKPYYEPPYFGPIIAFGRGLTGVLTAASTHRPGLVTNLDVAPTALAALGAKRAPSMIGSAFSARPNRTPLAERIASLARTGAAVGTVDKLRDRYFTPLYAWFAVICVGIVVAVAFWPTPRRGRVGRLLLLAVLCVPPAAWVALLIARYPASVTVAAVALGIAWFATFAAALAVARWVHPEAALAALAADTALLVMLDQWFGGPLQTGLFSYSIRAGWRYYGIGNEGSALAIGAALAAVGIACDLALHTRWAAPLRRYAIPVVGAIVLVTAAAPFAGANAGVAIWGFVAFAVAWARMNGIRFSTRTITWTIGAVALLVATLVIVDMLGWGGGTHIGRFFLGISQDGSGTWELVTRKALNNIGYVTKTPYTLVALAIALGLALERFAHPRPLAEVLVRYSAYEGALVGVLVGSVVAMLTEDSGVVMPALMLLAGALPALYLALQPAPASDDGPGKAPPSNS